jgi:hypothetical protein
MAAGEDELQPLVGDRRLGHPFDRVRRGLRELTRLLRQDAAAADAVDRPVSRRGHEPRAWVLRRSVAWPALGGDRERLLSGLLGEVEVAEEADQVGEDTSPLVAEGLLENR